MSSIRMERKYLEKALIIALTKLDYESTIIVDIVDAIKGGEDCDTLIHSLCKNGHNSPKSINDSCLECFNIRFEPSIPSSDGLMKRRDAISLGLKQYSTGNPCKHGHYSPRRTKSGACVECSINKKPIA